MTSGDVHPSPGAERRDPRWWEVVLGFAFLVGLVLLLRQCYYMDWDAPTFAPWYKPFKEQLSTFVALEPSDQAKAKLKNGYVKSDWVPGKMVLLEKETTEASFWTSERWFYQFPDTPGEEVLQYVLLAKEPDEATSVVFAFHREPHDVDVHIVDAKTKEVVAFRNFRGEWHDSSFWARAGDFGYNRTITWQHDILPWLNDLAGRSVVVRERSIPWLGTENSLEHSTPPAASQPRR